MKLVRIQPPRWGTRCQLWEESPGDVVEMERWEARLAEVPWRAVTRQELHPECHGTDHGRPAEPLWRGGSQRDLPMPASQAIRQSACLHHHARTQPHHAPSCCRLTQITTAFATAL